MSAPFEAFFLAADNGRAGQRLCIHHPPRRGEPARGAVLHLHAFAEEMNKSRRMVALQARALAEAGFAVLQIDLHGCGDSGGDFEVLSGSAGAMCTKQYDPVVVTVHGVWQGKRVAYERTFANECLKDSAASVLYSF